MTTDNDDNDDEKPFPVAEATRGEAVKSLQDKRLIETTVRNADLVRDVDFIESVDRLSDAIRFFETAADSLRFALNDFQAGGPYTMKDVTDREGTYIVARTQVIQRCSAVTDQEEQ